MTCPVYATARIVTEKKNIQALGSMIEEPREITRHCAIWAARCEINTTPLQQLCFRNEVTIV